MMLTLPWPQRVLSPNARCHWAVKARSAKAYRYECFVLAGLAKLRVDWDGPIHLHIGFYPPSNRGRDLDNCIASIKNGLDGLADALKVNDSRFHISAVLGLKRAGGEVIVAIGKV